MNERGRTRRALRPSAGRGGGRQPPARRSPVTGCPPSAMDADARPRCGGRGTPGRRMGGWLLGARTGRRGPVAPAVARDLRARARVRMAGATASAWRSGWASRAAGLRSIHSKASTSDSPKRADLGVDAGEHLLSAALPSARGRARKEEARLGAPRRMPWRNRPYAARLRIAARSESVPSNSFVGQGPISFAGTGSKKAPSLSTKRSIPRARSIPMFPPLHRSQFPVTSSNARTSLICAARTRWSSRIRPAPRQPAPPFGRAIPRSRAARSPSP